MDNQFYGWYDDPDQPIDQPTYEPPRDGPCLLCGTAINPDDVRTHSLMLAGPHAQYANRSYFYRTHASCADKHEAPDGFIFEMIERNGD